MSAFPDPRRRASLLAGCAIAIAVTGSGGAQAQAFKADITQSQGIVGRVTDPIGQGMRDTVTVAARQAIIDWTPTAGGTGPITILAQDDQLRFTPGFNLPGGTYTVLNRINPADPGRAILFQGTVRGEVGYGSTAPGGNLWFYSPGGIIAGATSRWDVGSLVLTSNAIDTSNGLFGSGITATSGKIRFRGVADSRASVIVQPGAAINAVGNYVALVAPRVTQNGAISVNGGAALVAGESVDLTVGVNGLFDIVVNSGSTVNAGGETVLIHDGDTGGPAGVTATVNRRVYLMAVPKNDIVTMLVSGSLGYQPAAGVDVVNGAVVLTTEPEVRDLAGGAPPLPTNPSLISVSGGSFRSATRIVGQDVSLGTTSRPLTFADALTVASTSGAVRIAATGSSAIRIGGALEVAHRAATTASLISVTADAGSLIIADSIALTAAVNGGSAGESAGGAKVSLNAAGGIIKAAADIAITVSSQGGDGFSPDLIGGSATGGSILLATSQDGQINAGGALDLIATASGGENGDGAGGIATGGSISLSAAGDALISAASLRLDAHATGGSGVVAGSARGGSATITLTSASFDADAVEINLAGSGGQAAFGGEAGAGTGGTASIAASGGFVAFDTLMIDAAGVGGDSQSFVGQAETGGTGTGGVIAVAVTGSALRGANLIDFAANGTGGGIVNRGGAGHGGTVALMVTGTKLANNGAVSLAARGRGADGERAGGGARGGTIALTANAGQITTFDLLLDATAIAGPSFASGAGGDGIGGTIALASTAGGLVSGAAELTVDGTGGDGFGDAPAGAGSGGLVTLRMNGGALDVRAEAASISASGRGGIASLTAPRVLARGGTIDIGVAGGGGALLVDSADFLADGLFDDTFEGSPFANHGGSGVGGSVLLNVAGGRVEGDAVLLSAGGFGASSPEGGIGGTGFGGRAELAMTGGSVALTALAVQAQAFGGGGVEQESGYGVSPGDGGAAGVGQAPFAGQAGAIVTVAGGSLAASSVTLDASSQGGAGGLGDVRDQAPRGGDGGDAEGALASFTSSATTALQIGALTVQAQGRGGAGGGAPQGGDGGLGGGGTAILRTRDGALDVLATSLDADGVGGAPGAGPGAGLAGTATGGSVRLDVDQSGAPSRQVRTGDTFLTASAVASLAVPATGSAGLVEILVKGSNPAGALVMTRLDTVAHGTSPASVSSAGIVVDGAGAPILVAGTASLDTIGGIDLGFSGDSGLRSADGLRLDAGGAIMIDHTGRTAGARSLSGGGPLLRLAAGTDFIAAADSLVHADSDVQLSAGRNVTIGGLSGTAASIGGGRRGGAADVRFAGLVEATNLSVEAPGDILFGFGADVGASGSGVFSAGDDIVIGAGAVVRGSSGPPPASAAGGPSMTFAARSDARNPRPAGDINALILQGQLLAPGGTVTIAAEAVAGAPDGVVRAGNLSVQLARVPEAGASVSDDLGQLSAPCLQGSVCLGTVDVAHTLEIGAAGFDRPRSVVLAGGVDATRILIRGGDVRLGRAGEARRIGASDVLQIEALDGSLSLDGALSITGGIRVARLAAAADLIGASASIAAPAMLDLAAGGTIAIADTAAAGGITATGAAISLAGANGLKITSATATGDLTLTTSAGTLDAGSSSAGNALTLNGAGGVRFGALTAARIAVTAGGDIQGSSARAGSIAITTAGTLAAGDLVATTGTLSAIAALGVSIDTAVSAGLTTLKADRGTITIALDIIPGEGLVVSAPSINLTGRNGLTIADANATAGDLILTTRAGDLIAGNSRASGAISLASAGALGFAGLTAQQGVTLTVAGAVTGGSVSGSALTVTAGGTIQIGGITGGPVTASGQALSLAAPGDLTIAEATATGGDIALLAAGNLGIGTASASGALTANAAAGIIALSGAAGAATIGFTSADIAIGAGARLGSVTQTASVTLTSTAPRTVIGGDGLGSGYRLGNDELARIAAREGVAIMLPPTQSSAAFTFGDPGAASMVLENLGFDGAQLGANGIFTLESPGSIGLVGNVQYRNFAVGQSVIYRAGSEIALAAETGIVTLKNDGGALAGTLRLQAPQVTALSVAARQQVPNLTLDQARQRLGTNDAVRNDGGYFQAGDIDVRIGRLLFIQNSGDQDIAARRGFTGTNVRIEATGAAPAQVVVNGRVQTGGGFAVGEALPDNLELVGQFDPQSSFSGCVSGDAGCNAPPPGPPGPPEEVTAMLFSVVRDQIQDEAQEDEQEEAITASQTRPDPVIQILTAPSSRLDPLIDEPITGAGNEDLWEPSGPAPGR